MTFGPLSARHSSWLAHATSDEALKPLHCTPVSILIITSRCRQERSCRYGSVAIYQSPHEFEAEDGSSSESVVSIISRRMTAESRSPNKSSLGCVQLYGTATTIKACRCSTRPSPLDAASPWLCAEAIVSRTLREEFQSSWIILLAPFVTLAYFVPGSSKKLKNRTGCFADFNAN